MLGNLHVVLAPVSGGRFITFNKLPNSIRSQHEVGAGSEPCICAWEIFDESEAAYIRARELNANILLGDPFYPEYLGRAGNTEQAIEHVRNSLSAGQGDLLSQRCLLVKMLTKQKRYLDAANAFPKSTDATVPVRDYVLDARGIAAAAAIRAADGQGVDAAGLSVEQRAALRSQSLAWLATIWSYGWQGGRMLTTPCIRLCGLENREPSRASTQLNL